ncbi:hypothetical protein Ancab_028861 [Ancistrocladus abbreviatus]
MMKKAKHTLHQKVVDLITLIRGGSASLPTLLKGFRISVRLLAILSINGAAACKSDKAYGFPCNVEHYCRLVPKMALLASSAKAFEELAKTIVHSKRISTLRFMRGPDCHQAPD